MVGHPLSALRPNGAAGSAFRSIKRRRGRPPATGSWTTLGPALPSGIPAPPPSSHSRHSLASRLAVSVTGRGSLDLQLHSPEPHRTRRAAPRPKRGSPYSPSAVPFVAVPRLFAPLQADVTPVDVDAVDCFRLSMHSISLEDSPTIVSVTELRFYHRAVVSFFVSLRLV